MRYELIEFSGYVMKGSFIYRGGKDYVTQVKRLKTFIEKLKGHACNEN